nr:unnamed protein product [Callosobruchus chinensis]
MKKLMKQLPLLL